MRPAGPAASFQASCQTTVTQVTVFARYGSRLRGTRGRGASQAERLPSGSWISSRHPEARVDEPAIARERRSSPDWHVAGLHSYRHSLKYTATFVMPWQLGPLNCAGRGISSSGPTM